MEDPPSTRSLAAGEVHVWLADLDVLAPAEHDAGVPLSPEEVERAGRLRFDLDRHRFVARRGLLRRLLEAYTGVPAADIRFEAEAGGKPRVAGPAGDGALRFSASSSEAVCVYAFAHGRELGVDVERIRADVDVEAVGRRALPAEERRALDALPAEERVPAFFARWVAVEATLKLSGEGIAGLDRVREGDPAPTLTPLFAPDGYAAALATEGPAPVVVERRWSEDAPYRRVPVVDP